MQHQSVVKTMRNLHFDVSQSIPDKEGLVVIGDFNGHVGKERADLERWLGGHSYGILNDEGTAVLHCAQMYDLAICNTFFQTKDEHMITCRSGTRQSTIDYIMVRRQSLRFVKFCKVIPGETVATQHRLLILEMWLEKPKKTKKRSREKKIKWWNLKNEEFELKFITQESGGGKYVEKETWWWDQHVQLAVKAKKEAFKNWKTTGNEFDKEIYKEHRKTAKIYVTKGKDLAYHV